YTNTRCAAFIFALLVSAAVTHIYYVVKKSHSPANLADELFVHLPFSLYHGWTTILVVLTAFEAFAAIPTSSNTWLIYFSFKILFRSHFCSRTPFIHWAAFAFALLSLVWVVKGAFGLIANFRRGGIALEDEERAPLTR
ncbi:hypothetical protein EI94DRAFT_1746395, partial [Lactarius quietus]